MRAIKFTLLLLSFITTAYGQNSLIIEDLEAASGDDTKIVIALNNTESISGFQFKIKVPNNLIVKEKEVSFTGRNTDHLIYPKRMGNGEYLFLCFSGSNANFTGQTGSLIEIPIEIPLTYNTGDTYDMTFTETIVSSSAGVDIGSNHQNGELTIIEGENPDLQVGAISVLQNDILPNAPYSISWEVENIGLSAAIGGWREQIAIVSQTNGKKYIIGNANYSNPLTENETITRDIDVIIPRIIGFDGEVKIEITLITNAEVREPANTKENNTAISNDTQNLLKRLIFTLSKNEVFENSDDVLRLKLVRSGDTSIAEDFTVSSDAVGAFNLPSTVTIGENESSKFLYVNTIDNETYEGDRTVNIIAQSAAYSDESVSLTLLDDEDVVLSLEYPEVFESAIGSNIPFTLNANFSVDEDRTITLSTDLPQRLQLPSQVTLLANSTTITFNGTILDSQIIEKAETANIIAKADGYTTAVKEIKLGAINLPDFTISINPAQISEGDGIKASYATLKRTDQLDKPVTVKISANTANQLILPSEITFQIGESEKIFNIGAVNNSEVEGERTVIITSKIKFDSCSCVDDTEPSASVNGNITILDNDGLALNIKITPSTIKAGADNNTLVISRNTEDPNILQNTVIVNLSSDLGNIIELPDTVTIPANQKEVEVTFNTIIDPNQDGDETARIQVDAAGYSSGFGWILISNQNKPDASISEISTNISVEAGTKIDVTSFIKNQGNIDYPTKSKIDYYLSKTPNIGSTKPFVSSIINKVIAVDENFEYIENIQLPNFSGDYYLTVKVNADYSINELDYENNENQIQIKLLPSYSVDLTLDKEVYETNEIVEVTGVAKNASDENVPNADIALKIKNADFVKDYTVKTDANGTFVFEYVPFENENGSYTVAASFPGEDVIPQESFELLGLDMINKPQYIKWETVVNEPLGKEFILKNKTNTKLTGVSIQLPADAEFSIEQTPMDIEPGETINFPYTLVSTVASLELKYTEFKIVIQSNEGATYTEQGYYYSKDQEAKLLATPISINTTMVKDQARLYEVAIKNVGAIDAENVEILLPELGWLRLNSQKVIERIKPNEEVKIILEFKPTVKEQVNVPINGNFVVKQQKGKSISIPFRLETVSESTGNLIVDATDEYTYNTASAPHLKDAKVIVKHPFTGVVIAEGLTNELGLFEVPNINEGWYVVNISAEKHNPYQNNILVDPGKDTKVTAFLPYQAVTYSWDVERIEILDEYDITLQVDFETNVPLPVVVMEIDNPKLDLNPGESRMTYITVTNHGLIAARKVSINTGEADGYSIQPLITSLDELNAKSAVTIPVLVKNTSDGGKTAGSNKSEAAQAGGGSCNVPVTLRAVYICDTEKELFSYTAYVNTCASTGGAGPIITGGCSGCGPGGVGGGSGSGYGYSPGSGTSTLTSFPDFCDPCTKSITSTVLSCNPYTSALSCAFGLLTSTSLTDLGLGAAGCVSSPFGCIWSIITLKDCFPSGGGSSGSSKTQYSKSALDEIGGNFDYIFEDFEKITEAETAHLNMLSEYFQNPDLEGDNDNLSLFLSITGNAMDSETVLTPEDVITLKNAMAETTVTTAYIDSFVTRWNTTIEAWDLDILSPNTSYPDIIDKVQIEEYKKIKTDLLTHAFTRGFVSVADMYNSDIESIEEFVEEKSKDAASVCASVTIEFPQRLTMTREAFEGTLKINNSSAKAITEINLELVVKDEFGENKSHLFQINKEAFLNGEGIVDSDSNGQGLVTFIPTKEAAPQVVKSYAFGGILSYFDPEVGETVSIALNPVTLEVNPSPDLILHYFMQRDILGDDALTKDIVEPSIPAELSLMITNDGYGLATNVNVESMQPEIVENEKGLLIDFNMIGSNFNNEPTQLGLLNVDFGDIQPKTSAVGQWFFTSSLIGHFVEFDVKVNHKSSFGNANLSLIKGAFIHELVRSVKSYGTDSDDISDFLVNDVSDVYDTPDMIYLSDGTSEDVSEVDAIEITEAVTPATLTSKIRINPSTTGWNYGNILNPAAKNYTLARVVRDSDSFEIPLQNFWQTHVTLKDGLNPKYENKLHVLDKISNIETYTLYFTPIDGDIPQVIAFIDPPEEYNTTSVDFITVEFNKEIDFNTFTFEDVEVIHQGASVPTDNVLIGKIDATTFSINIEALTAQSGFYELTVNTIGIKDLAGNDGRNGKKLDWLQFVNELGILKFESDQLKKNPLNSIDIIFNKPIRTEEFTEDKITINDTPVSGLTILKVDDYNYTISGINPLNEDNGDYTIAIDVTNIKATDGVSGLAVQTFNWMVDTNLPEVIEIQTASQGATNTQNITQLEIELNRAIISELEPSAFQFTKNGQDLDIPIIIQKTDDLHYTIYGLGSFTADNGTYRVIIDQSTFIDENDNFGEGIAETSWTVRLDALNAFANLKLTPDRGISSTDNITSGSDVQLIYETLIDNITVEVYELLGTSEVLINKQLTETSGEYGVPVSDYVGAKRFKVVAYDDLGNRSNAEVLSAYIDFTDIITDIQPVDDVSNDCSDFNYVDVTFSDEINESSFTIDAITLKSSGVEIPKNDVTIRKITDKAFVIENIQNDNDGSITLEIDKTKITKQISGLNGFITETKELGSSATYAVTIIGEENPNIDGLYEYTADANMNKYDWIIINGEIVSKEGNKVTVKWNKLNLQSLILRYKTPLNCDLTASKEVIVKNESLDVEDNQNDERKSFIAPIPNNGKFTVHTSMIIDNCTLDIYDSTGKQIYQEKNVDLSSKMKDIDINLNAGMYILILHNSEEKLNFKFIIN
ncbi:T9SS type A sorting domain-containing protein [Algibacter amylolyticus]|uniref:T9SS type A sorting domain-containing protein n=1 Tax=Algibacter amylolyticus TaxID=1608400 RepID=A0A5M7B279_9FLAO|nr:T9SS type A sorting domain-containing protein [Algibacter amylolyticus]KAA5823693.1 T9SS type A sorting domain-containing protein [Algibacter amylolyticus]MBB5267862.1 hypothetical protein [Algibacter amylolyticus]TSJ74181.1 T9SS type A sorting domain-containing protein [Algibacter amylolyticus]